MIESKQVYRSLSKLTTLWYCDIMKRLNVVINPLVPEWACLWQTTLWSQQCRWSRWSHNQSTLLLPLRPSSAALPRIWHSSCNQVSNLACTLTLAASLTVESLFSFSLPKVVWFSPEPATLSCTSTSLKWRSYYRKCWICCRKAINKYCTTTRDIAHSPACISRRRMLIKRKSGLSSGSSLQHSSIFVVDTSSD